MVSKERFFFFLASKSVAAEEGSLGATEVYTASTICQQQHLYSDSLHTSRVAIGCPEDVPVCAILAGLDGMVYGITDVKFE